MQKKDILTIYENIHLSYIEKYYPDEKEKNGKNIKDGMNLC